MFKVSFTENVFRQICKVDGKSQADLSKDFQTLLDHVVTNVRMPVVVDIFLDCDRAFILMPNFPIHTLCNPPSLFEFWEDM